jgi:hypothetical protein
MARVNVLVCRRVAMVTALNGRLRARGHSAQAAEA